MPIAAPLVTIILFCALVAEATAAPIEITKFDSNHSTVAFRVPILGGMSEVEGKFLDFAVDVTYDEADISKSGVTAIIKAASIDTGITDRDKHLRSSDFLDAEKYPEIKFESSRIQKTADGFVAQGTLTMRGVTKPLSLPFRVTGNKRDEKTQTFVVAFAAETHLNRRDFGINWTHSVDPTFVGDDITVVIHLITKRVPLPTSR
jgi:polyisoprenoid-binding protein YceI